MLIIKDNTGSHPKHISYNGNIYEKVDNCSTIHFEENTTPPVSYLYNAKYISNDANYECGAKTCIVTKTLESIPTFYTTNTKMYSGDYIFN